MKLRHLWVAAAATASLVTLSACQSDEVLGVDNTNNPDVERAISTPDGVENVLKNGFAQVLGATHGTSNALWPAAQATALESYGSVANFGLAQRSAIPRSVIDNTKGNPTQAENLRDFQELTLRGRLIANALGALRDQQVANPTASIGTAFQDARARAFGFFAMGLANGELALMYDSVGVVHPNLDRKTPPEIPPLSGYSAAMGVALQQLDSALAYASAARTATGSSAGSLAGFLPTTWMRRSSATSVDEFVQLVRSTKARLRAGVARNPAERAAVDWNAVAADAAAGIQADWVLDMNANEGWSAAWLNQMAVSTGWSGMTPAIVGMADTTSGYPNWVGVDRSARLPFLISTPDKRFPAGATRAAQLAASPALAQSLPSIYFRNRPPGDDVSSDSYGSFYDHVRFTSYRQGSSVGKWVWMSRTEIDMLQAEGLIRLGRDAEAVPLVNRTRVINGLPPFPDAVSRAPAQPGGSATSCVPRTPTGPGNTVECGTLYEAMKWEKRMETLFTGWAQWFFDSRGWNDLPNGSPLMYPVPYQEMDARGQPFYNGQIGNPVWQAVGNTYGFGIGSR